jgi:hypothetical protein
MKYRKKPVVIDAVQFTEENKFEVAEFMKDIGEFHIHYQTENDVYVCDIDTLEGTMRANEGDWIIRGIKGEFYPCKPDIFAATYEAV